ncbi:MAG TPA: Asp-tRNA(Asn)/Glu-tRNA(Gln) amidotransferase subunit GatB, partial [Candidatus Moranbacteria bacterium]|nr:Asp-tRNA(Asn)/Glu-tRNA(Gln) amidotransferase subunit GatB [Candidatus Moranbacteria bacterium]
MLETVVGIEVHAELSTKSKIFCSCENKFGGEPNTRCCPVCLGLPGALPVLSREAVRLCIIAGFAMNCEISETVKMARKNYFYPDLPKGYQITQDETPLCKNGFIKLSNGRKIRIERIHIEEDAGKLIHDDDPTLTFIDYNRCGVPLIEIVTKPDIRSTDEAREFFDKIKTLLKFTGVSDCKMQEGSLRCDVNVSVKDLSEERYRPRVEYKNINSFGAALRAIGYEAKRQMEIYEKGEAVEPATMKWDDVKGEGLLLRSKENAADYRYFPEPDIPK